MSVKMMINFSLVLIVLGYFANAEEVKCGTRKVDSEKSLTAGDSAEMKEFPWLVLLKYEDANGTNAGYRCLGTLLNSKAVITSAGCVEPQEVTLKGVRLGEYNLATDTDCTGEGDKKECIDPAKDVGVEKKIVHSDYNSTTGDNDIAIVILDQKVDFSDSVQPLCLPKADTETKPGDKVVASGWGRSVKGELIVTMKRVVSTVVSDEDCAKDYSKATKIVTKNNVCTKELPDSKHFTCAGDSGGPLMSISDNVWSLIGITSFGIGCGNTFADGNTKVSNYVSWITDNIKV